MIIVLALVAPVGVAFVLIWWKSADKWAGAEHRRFKPKEQPTTPHVVVKSEHSEKPRE
jgi:hypothetical protein